MMKRRNMFNRFAIAGALPAVFAAAAATAQEAEGDGFPHIAIAEEDTGEIAVEFEVTFGLDETGPVPTLNLVAPDFSNLLQGFVTRPLTPSEFPNSDLGFVSEVEGATEEGGAINADIIVRVLDRTDNFGAFSASLSDDLSGLIFTDTDPEIELGNAFDEHPTWIILSDDPNDLSATASASFEVFDVSSGSEVSLGQFNINLSVPEPTSAFALIAGAGLLAARRRRR